MNEIRIPVLVKVTSSERDEHGRQETPMQLLMPGELYRKNENWVLCYQETLRDDGDQSEVTHDVHLMLKDGHVTLLRKGPYSLMMVLERGKRYQGVYHTPYGDMQMAVFPSVVKTEATESKGQIVLEYQLDMMGGYAAVRRMVIEYNAQQGRSKPC